MSKHKPPLFDFFLGLREEAGLPLTIDQYHLLLQALEGGFGIANREELKQICRLLWLKSESSPQTEKFEQYFEQYFAQFDESLKSQNQNRKSKHTSNKTDADATKVPTSFDQIDSNSLVSNQLSSESSSQVPTAIRGNFLNQKSLKEDNYQLTIKDLLISERQIQQNWRYLRRPIREGTLSEVDIEATVEKISLERVFLEPVLVPRRINRAQLLLLIDISNSMVPFNLLSQRLVDNLQGGRLGKADIYYFRNCPQDYLYLHPQFPDAKLIEDLLSKLHSRRTVGLIISDGGAARGGMSRERIELTAMFLEELAPVVRQVAWLNPIPESRWEGTTAQEISQLVPMFELNDQGLKTAIRLSKIGN
ncbi:MAG: hypothetical protein C6Y22_10430 [Hapalosiphonaceae cyanobacterium JJU2]|nr:MAG: hypothetical protein C6Y22_10430 [Hapalosiphonaceae cyanobacterium JJU2]